MPDLRLEPWRGHGGARCQLKGCSKSAHSKIGVGPARLALCEYHAYLYFTERAKVLG